MDLSTTYAHVVPSETRATYHHGALRDELVAACVALIETEGIGAVSLRRVAREAGVSPGAPYHHFADRSALLTAISMQGYDLLTATLRTVKDSATTSAGALRALVEAYVRFAAEHPAHVHLMLRPELAEPHKHPDAQAAGAAAIAILTEAVIDAQRDGTVAPGDPEPLVGLIWALAVGIVTLWLDGPLESRCAQLGTTPQQLTADIGVLLERLVLGAQSPPAVGKPR